MAASFVVCLRCGKVHEIAIADQLPRGWERSHGDLLCPHCADTVLVVGAASSVLDEEVIYPARGAADDTLDEDHCDICDGSCQGH